MKKLCFIDIETTGTIFNYHEIIEIGMILTNIDGLKIFDKLELKLQPRFPERITPKALKINNYNLKDWKDAVSQSEKVWTSLKNFWENSIPVCHNPSFERAFITLAMLEHEFEDTGLGCHWIGTESLSWHLYVNGKISELYLSSIADYFGIEQEPFPHTAINGAHQCRNVYLKLNK